MPETSNGLDGALLALLRAGRIESLRVEATLKPAALEPVVTLRVGPVLLKPKER